jgi:hypothetical protein
MIFEIATTPAQCHITLYRKLTPDTPKTLKTNKDPRSKVQDPAVTNHLNTCVYHIVLRGKNRAPPNRHKIGANPRCTKVRGTSFSHL